MGAHAALPLRRQTRRKTRHHALPYLPFAHDLRASLQERVSPKLAVVMRGGRVRLVVSRMETLMLSEVHP